MRAIESLMQKKGKFDYILLETTGLADPGPIAAMFWLDDELGSEIYLDGKLLNKLLLLCAKTETKGKNGIGCTYIL